MQKPFPNSIAIAGAWGYIGRKFLHAARELGLTTWVFDPGPAPADVDPSGFTRLDRESDFYSLPADLFHLALHAEHRGTGLARLIERGHREPLLVLCEKPMALPECPEDCSRLVAAARSSRTVLLYDFPELFDPILNRILDCLSAFRDVQIESIWLQRSKDREDSSNPRNYKRMVPIQYQESVHCLAFALRVLAAVQGSLDSVLAGGLRVTARAEPYDPPNPQVYPYVVDGKCDYEIVLGRVTLTGRTDFKRQAEWAKRRIIRGTADGQPLLIEADFLEGQKRLVINGQPQPDVAATDSYAEVIKTCGRWYGSISTDDSRGNVYPTPSFAHVTYQLSSVLWRSSDEGKSIAIDSLAQLMSYNAGFAERLPHLPRYAL
jgi:predicted dehydrogenase